MESEEPASSSNEAQPSAVFPAEDTPEVEKIIPRKKIKSSDVDSSKIQTPSILGNKKVDFISKVVEAYNNGELTDKKFDEIYASKLGFREFTSEDERRVTIVLDTRQVADNGQRKFTERFERGVTLAASLVKHFIDEHAEVRLVLGADRGRYGGGLKQLYQCLRRLAVVSPQKQNGDAELPTAVGDPESVKDDNEFVTFLDRGVVLFSCWVQ